MSALWLGLWQIKYWGLAWGPITETFHHTSSSHPGKTHVRPRSVAMVSVRDLGGVGRAQGGGGCPPCLNLLPPHSRLTTKWPSCDTAIQDTSALCPSRIATNSPAKGLAVYTQCLEAQKGYDDLGNTQNRPGGENATSFSHFLLHFRMLVKTE